MRAAILAAAVVSACLALGARWTSAPEFIKQLASALAHDVHGCGCVRHHGHPYPW